MKHRSLPTRLLKGCKIHDLQLLGRSREGRGCYNVGFPDTVIHTMLFRPYYTYVYGLNPGMTEFPEGKGCNFSSKGYIILKTRTNRNQRALAFL